MNRKNPFYCKGPLSPEADIPTMIWRRSILEELRADINDGYFPILIGPRQTGKTTIANQLIWELKEDTNKKNITCYFECSTIAGANEEEVINYFFESIIDNLEKEKERLKELKLTSELTLLKHGVKPKTCYEFFEFLEELITIFKEVDRIILIIDEIKVLPKTLLIKVLSVFRGIASKYLHRIINPRYSILLLCQKNLTTFDLGAGSPYNINVRIRRISNFSFNEFEQLIELQHKKEFNYIFEDNAKKFIFEETNGHPYLSQRICHEVVKKTASKHFFLNDIILAVLSLFEGGNRNLRITIDSIQKNTKSEEEILHLIQGRRIPFERVYSSIRYLEEKGIIKEDDEKKICIFRCRIYERLFLNKYFYLMTKLSGKYLLQNATYLIRISEIQRVLLNEDISKRVKFLFQNYKNIKNKDKIIIKELKNILTENPLVINLDFIKNCLLFWKTDDINIDSITRESILKILYSLFLEKFEEKL